MGSKAVRVVVAALLGSAGAFCGDPSPHLQFSFGGAPGERYGAAAAALGDVDGDGIPEVAIGAPAANEGASNAGRLEVRSGATGLVLATASGDHAFDRLGSTLAGPGDLDGDGVPDLVAGAPAGTPGSGEIVALSGADGALLWSAAGVANGDRFGAALAPAFDVDGDGVVDLVVGSPDHDGGGFGAGRAEVRSGATGALLWSATGTAVLDRFGHAVAGILDAGGDGIPDVAVGAPLADGAAFNGGGVEVRDGATGALLLSLAGSSVLDQFGYAVARGGDVDADGRADVVVGVPGHDGGGADAGRVELRSGKDGALLLGIDGLAAGETLGFVAGGFDLDGDLVPDVAAGAPSSSPGGLTEAGEVRVWSGKDGTLLFAVPGTDARGWLGNTVVASGDVDGDGVPDLLVGAPVHDDDVQLAGRALLLSGAPRALVAGGHTISAGAGGVVPFVLRSSPPLPGGSWILLGSTGGTSPGTLLGGVFVPLAGNDPYFLFRLAHPTAPPLFPALGVLDAQGTATSAFVLPPNVPASTIGTTVHHAALVAASGASRPAFASEAVPITLLP